MLRIGIRSKTDIEYGEILGKFLELLEINLPTPLKFVLKTMPIEKLSNFAPIKNQIINGMNKKIEERGFEIKISDIELKDNEIVISSEQTSKADIEDELKKLLNNFLRQKGISENEIDLEKVSLKIAEQE
jgi:hypothetical protein